MGLNANLQAITNHLYQTPCISALFCFHTSFYSWHTVGIGQRCKGVGFPASEQSAERGSNPHPETLPPCLLSVAGVKMKYGETKKENRWLILSDEDQTFPTNPLEIVKAEDRPTAKGGTMPVLVLSDRETGSEYTITAWKRDVLACIEEYGDDTDSWDDVKFEKNNNGKWKLVPAGMKPIYAEKVN